MGYENFLNSYAFEQMTKEYNKKYCQNKVSSLNIKKDEKLLLKVTNTFDKVFHLFYLFSKNFSNNKKFKLFFEEWESLKGYINEINLYIYNKEYIIKDFANFDNKFNHKICSLKVFDVYNDIFCILNDLQKDFFDNKNEKNFICKDDLQKENIAIFNYFLTFFDKFNKLLKIFYLEI